MRLESTVNPETGSIESPKSFVDRVSFDKSAEVEKHHSTDEESPMDEVREIDKSAGVTRMELIDKCSNVYERGVLLFGIFLVGYTYSLGATINSNMRTAALTAMNQTALQSSVNTISSVVAAAALPTGAKISDVFGRLELFLVALLFHVLGNIVCASANNLATLSGGVVLYTIGYAMIQIMLEVLIADVTTIRSRVFWSFLPAVPFIINTWVSGDINSAIIGDYTTKLWMWRWGFGMWCLILPVMSLPLIGILAWLQFKAHKTGLLKNHPTVFGMRKNMKSFIVELFWLLDVIGIILMIGVFILLLYPLTVAGGYSTQWKKAKIIAPLVVGFCLIPVLVIYELWAPHPIIPFRKMGHRHMIATLTIALMLDFVWYMQGDYLYTMLMVGFGFGTTAATRVSSLYSFCSVISGPITGLFVYFTRRVKIYIVGGVSLFMVAFGMLIHYRGGSSSKSGVIGAEVVLGIAGGMFSYPTQAVIQAYVPHENLAVITGLYLSFYNIGSALGVAVSGAVYTQRLPIELRKYVPTNNSTILTDAYTTPLTLITQYPMGTPIREGMVDAYQHVQRLMCIVGVCLCVILLAAAFALPNPIFVDRRSLVEEDEDTTNRKNGVFDKISRALTLPPKQRKPAETKWKRFVDELW